MIFSGLNSQAESSHVYRCHFTDEINATTTLRMKEYFDAASNRTLGKVDLIVGTEVKESTLAQVLEVPIWESDSYLKIWYAPPSRIDAVLSWSSSSREFTATYLTNGLTKPISCSRVTD